ncbi:Cytochrome P450 [Dillenia turbinata]|uniref:Cytochrome P450 n=1 Tax=Dillenia turbinata TaxID=194707 RepID=A0AAN8UX63_9MAGN
MDIISFFISSIGILFLLFTIAFLTLLVQIYTGKSIRDPEYHPVSGTVFDQVFYFNRLYDYQTETAHKHPTFRLLAPEHSEIYTTDPRNIEHMLKTKFDMYTKGQYNQDIASDLFGQGIFNVDTDKWRQQRKLASFEFSTRVLRDFSCSVFRKNAAKLAGIVSKLSDSDCMFDVQDLLMRNALDSIFKVGFGVELNCLERSSEQGIQVLKAFDNDKEDILSRFLIESKTDPKRMTDQYLRDIILNFMLAGKDSSANTLSWFLYMMCKNPLIQEKVVQEIREVMDGGENDAIFDEFTEKVTDAVLEKMHYLHATITETLRLYPAVPVDGRCAEADDILPDGFKLNKGDGVYYMAYTMGRMAHIWGEDAEEFCPERWLSNGVFQPASPFKFIAFHAGPRICLGRDFAYRQMKIVAMTLLHFFRFKLAHDTKKVTYKTMFTLHINGGLHLCAFSRTGTHYHSYTEILRRFRRSLQHLDLSLSTPSRELVMASLDFLLTIAVTVSCSILGFLAVKKLISRKSSIEKRKKYHPVAGTVFNQLLNFKRLHHYMTDLAGKHRTYRLISPSGSEIYTSDPANVEYILKTNFDNFGKGSYNYVILKDLLGDGIFTVDGDKWRQQRKVSSHEFSTRVLRDFSSVVFRRNAAKLADLISKAADSNQVMDIQDLFMKSTLDSIFKVAFGVELDSMCGSSEEGTHFGNAFDDASAMTLWRYVDIFWKVKEFLNIGSEALLKKKIKVIDSFVYKLIQNKKEQMQNAKDDSVKKEDILSRFLQLTETDNKYLRDIVLNFVIAGKDTTATALSWFVYMSCKHPAIQEKDAKICLSDDTLPDGYNVKKGDMIAYQPYAMGRMKFIWGDDAEDFRPERWLDADGFFQQESPFKFTAFQAGPRICLGKEFAYRQMKIFSAVLLAFFTFKMNDDKQVVNYRTMINLHIDGGLHVRAFRR